MSAAPTLASLRPAARAAADRTRRPGDPPRGRALGARWRGGAVAAWITGACAGVAPAAFLGEPAPGLAASALLGGLGVAVLAPMVVTPLVATIVCDDDRHQVAPAWHAIGVAAPRRLALRTAAAARASLRLVVVGAAAGAASGIGLALTGRDPVRPGLAGGPGPAALGLGLVLLVVAWVVGGTVAAAAVTPARALLVLVLSVTLTGAVASLLYFSSGLRVAFWCTPWAALWPFDPDSFDSAQFATAVPVGVRLASGATWFGVLAAMAARRSRATPYPVPGERRRRTRD